MKKLCLLSVILCAAMIVAALPAFAQPYSPSEAAEQTYGKVKVKLSTGGSYQFETDAKKGGEFSLYSINGGVNVLYNFNPCTTLDTALGYEYLNYDFDDVGAIRFPWNKIHRGEIRSVLRWRESEQWEYFGGPIFTLGMEEGADWDDAIGGGITAGFKYFHSDTLTIGAGLVGLSKLEKSDPLIVPVILIDWKFAPGWQLRNGGHMIGTSAPSGLEVAWRCIEPLELVVGAAYMRRDFRLSDKRRRDVDDGIGQERGVPLYVAANMDVTKNMRLSVFGGGIVNGKIRLEDKRGDALRSEGYRATPIAGAKLGICF